MLCGLESVEAFKYTESIVLVTSAKSGGEHNSTFQYLVARIESRTHEDGKHRIGRKRVILQYFLGRLCTQ